MEVAKQADVPESVRSSGLFGNDGQHALLHMKVQELEKKIKGVEFERDTAIERAEELADDIRRLEDQVRELKRGSTASICENKALAAENAKGNMEKERLQRQLDALKSEIEMLVARDNATGEGEPQLRNDPKLIAEMVNLKQELEQAKEEGRFLNQNYLNSMVVLLLVWASLCWVC